MKKILLCVLTLGLGFALTGCGSGTKVDAEEARAQINGAMTKTNEGSYTTNFNSEIEMSLTAKSVFANVSGKMEVKSNGIYKVEAGNFYSKSTAALVTSGAMFESFDLSSEATSEAYLMKNGTNFDVYYASYLKGENSEFTYTSSASNSELVDGFSNSDIDLNSLIKNWGIFRVSGNVYTATNISLADLNIDELDLESAKNYLDESSIKIKKLAITLNDDGALAKVEINISANVSEEGSSVSLSMSAKVEYSNYGTTTVTVPTSIASLKPAA